MPKSSNQKPKLMRIAQILLEESDEEHRFSVNQLIERLDQEGISAERKSIYSDIEQLKDMKYDIVDAPGKGREKTYYIASREFELPELKLLADAVASSKFITQKKSDALIKKLGTLTSRYLSGQIRRQVFVGKRVKTANENIYYNVDAIHNAISANRQVSFRYFNYGFSKNDSNKPEKIYRGDERFVSPYSLVWDDENYYLIAYDERHPGKLTHFRVDKMERVTVSSKKRLDVPNNIDVKEYSNKLFGMFAGEKIMMKLKVDNSLIGIMYDRFGIDIHTQKADEDHFYLRAEAYDGPPLIGWLLQFGTGVEVISPDSLRDKISDTVNSVKKMYE